MIAQRVKKENPAIVSRTLKLTLYSKQLLTGLMREAILFLTNSTLLTAVAATALYSGVAYNYGKFNALMAAFIGSSTWSVYLLHRLIKVLQGTISDPRLKHWLIRNFRLLSFLLVILFVSLAFFLVFLKLTSVQWIYLLLFSFISIWYVIPVGGNAVRNIPYIKSPIVAITWSLHLFYFPLFFEEPVNDYWLEIVNWVLFFYAITIPFDSRDSEKDSDKMKTLPQLVGKKNAGIVALLLIAIFGVIALLVNNKIGNNFMFWSVILALTFTLYRFRQSKSYIAYAIFDLLMILLGSSYFIN